MPVQQRVRGGTTAAALVILTVVATAARQSPAPARSSFDELYRRGKLANAAIRTLTAQFTETTTSSLLVRPLVARGSVTVQRPSRLILRYTDPDRRVVFIDGDRMTTSWPSRKMYQVSNVSRAQERVRKYFIDGTLSDLRREFDIVPRADSDRPSTYEVMLQPKRRQIRETLSRLDLWVDPSTSLLAAMRMTFASGDTKLMAFEDVVANPPLDADAFNVEH